MTAMPAADGPAIMLYALVHNLLKTYSAENSSANTAAVSLAHFQALEKEFGIKRPQIT